jgi:hypothetical protein
MSDDEIETVKKMAKPRVGWNIYAVNNSKHNNLTTCWDNSLNVPLFGIAKPESWNQRIIGSRNLPGWKVKNTITYWRLVNCKVNYQLTKYCISACFLQVTRRVGDVTGLDMATAEDLQVVNYGIGGHYEPHFDYARVSAFIQSYILYLLFTTRKQQIKFSLCNDLSAEVIGKHANPMTRFTQSYLDLPNSCCLKCKFYQLFLIIDLICLIYVPCPLLCQ